MPKILFVLIFVLMSLPGFPQEGTESSTSAPEPTPTSQTKEALSPDGGTVTIRPGSDSAVEDASVDPAAPTLSEDEAIRELEIARQKQLEKMQMIQKTTEPLAKPIKNPLKEIQALGHKQLNAVALLDAKVLAILQRLIKEGQMSRITPEALNAQIYEKVKGSFWEKVLRKYPVLVDIFVEVIRSKEALGGLLGIFVRKEDLKTYGYLWLAIFVFGALIKNRLIKPKWPFKKRFAFSMTISLFLTVATLAIFYNFFSEELNPTLAIIGKHLL